MRMIECTRGGWQNIGRRMSKYWTWGLQKKERERLQNLEEDDGRMYERRMTGCKRGRLQNVGEEGDRM
jgi:hypothetical protein